jgi:hypothetical protein
VESDESGSHKNNKNAERCVDGCPPLLSRFQIWRQCKKDRTAYHRVDDCQNSQDRLRHLMQVVPKSAPAVMVETSMIEFGI